MDVSGEKCDYQTMWPRTNRRTAGKLIPIVSRCLKRRWRIKADMKSYIPLETATMFFLANRLLARSMSWLISFAWSYLTCEERESRITKWNFFCPQWDSNPRPSTYEENAPSVELLELINIDLLKVNAFHLSLLCKLPVPRGRCNNDLLCIFLI